MIFSYSDRFQELVQKPITGLDWSRFPKELKPEGSKPKKATKRKATAKPNLVRIMADILECLLDLSLDE